MSLNLLDSFQRLTQKITPQFVYHILPKQMEGEILLPPSELPKALYTKEKAKYEGREDWFSRQIPKLHCTAEDVLQFSTLDPIKLFRLFKLLGLEKVSPKTILRFPIQAFQDREIVLFSYGKELDYDYQLIQPEDYQETTSIPPDTVSYYLSCLESGESPLIFEFVPHLLLKGSLDINQATKILYQPK